jgi:hypothetical protein
MAIYRNVNLNATPSQVKGTGGNSTGGQLEWIWITNASSGWRYVKFYDAVTVPSVGTDTPVLTMGIPPGGGGNSSDIMRSSIIFANGIWVAATTAAPDADTGNPSANDVVANLVYR